MQIINHWSTSDFNQLNILQMVASQGHPSIETVGNLMSLISVLVKLTFKASLWTEMAELQKKVCNSSIRWCRSSGCNDLETNKCFLSSELDSDSILFLFTKEAYTNNKRIIRQAWISEVRRPLSPLNKSLTKRPPGREETIDSIMRRERWINKYNNNRQFTVNLWEKSWFGIKILEVGETGADWDTPLSISHRRACTLPKPWRCAKPFLSNRFGFRNNKYIFRVFIHFLKLD